MVNNAGATETTSATKKGEEVKKERGRYFRARKEGDMMNCAMVIVSCINVSINEVTR